MHFNFEEQPDRERGGDRDLFHVNDGVQQLVRILGLYEADLYYKGLQ